ncbi:MAG: helix-turn-helix domain-containing protein [Halochromatium sp.]
MEAVLEHTRGNQSAAAAILGISRGTLRKKLAQRAAAP